MARVLVAVGSCSDAFGLAPLVHACRAAHWTVDVAWFGDADGARDAAALGLRPTTSGAALPEQTGARRDAAAIDFLARTAELLPPDLVVTTGHGTLARAAGTWSLDAGVPLVRVDAGQRSGDAADRTERRRRAADHAATHWCVATDLQQLELAREGLPTSRIHTVGSLLPAALAALGAPAPVPPFVWLALEHADAGADATALGELLARVAAAARAHGLPVHAAAPGLAPALDRLAIELPAGIELRRNLDARGQLDAARRARVLVTDSAGYQALAAVAGVPCLLAAVTTARPETVRSGASQLVGARGERLPEAFDRALQRQPAPHPYGDRDAAAAIRAVLDAIVAAPDDARPTPAPAPAGAGPTLPSDGDHTGRTLGDDEVALVAVAIRSGTLNSTRGTFVTAFERAFARWLGTRHAIACNSGSMAVHAAIAALGLQPGDEVVTTPITDMGALTPILYEGAVPVFADVDPTTRNVTAATIAAQLTLRTRAIVVTHLFGLPCDLAAILALARARNLPVIEDCAQAFGATIGDRKVGTFGRIASFSLQQGKHITTGEGGIVATDDDALARRLFLFVNKAWGYGDPKPDHTFPALNGRLSELQGAVALAQLPKLDDVVRRRRAVAADLRARLAAVRGLRLPDDPPYGTHAYWKFAFDVDAGVLPGGALALGKRMQQAGINCVPRYVQKPAFECALFQDWRRAPVTWLPLQHNPRRDGPMPPFTRDGYPGATAGLESVVVLPINERYRPDDTARVAAAIAAAAEDLARG
ncbi:MAG: DegT/DnrJ/EryC1/StrS family aminotransferase [Planctomycetes bacterium]|nr:DegT/DnrJ/EryC1/StrS family aminotransferase [Planctomycetota bacterium]